MFNALKQPVKSVKIIMHNGCSFTQHVKYDHYPLLCTKYMKIGHTADRCRVGITNEREKPNPPRSLPSGDDAGSQVQRSRRGE